MICTFKVTRYYLHMYLKVFATSVLKHISLIHITFVFSAPELAQQACLKNAGEELELLTNTDMLLMVQKGIRGGICHAIHRYATTNNKDMRKHNKGKESSYLMYWDANNLYEQAMSQKLLLRNLNPKRYIRFG